MASAGKGQRTAFLLVLAIGITLLFLWVIQSFVIPLLMAAILAAIAHPFHLRLTNLFGGRKGVAAGLTIVLGLLLVIVPILLFVGVLVDQALDISESAAQWVSAEVEDPAALQKKLDLQKLLPYQDQIMAKASEMAAKAGSLVVDWLTNLASGTAKSLLLLFVALSAMFGFLVDGGALVESALRFTPLEPEDKEHLLGTFASVGRATLKGTLIVGIVQGALGGLAFWVAGIEGALFWAAAMALLSIVPGIGTALVWVPAVIYLALNGQMAAAVGVGLWCALVVGTIDNVLRPLLVGKDTEMPDLLVMITTLGGLALFGIDGLLIGPIIGALLMTVWRLWGGAMEEAGATPGGLELNS